MNCFKLKPQISIKNINIINKKFISALYVTGDKAKENYAVLQPYMNFSEVFNNPELMKENIKNRKLNINFDKTNKKYRNYCKIVKQKNELNDMRDKNVEKLRACHKNNEKLIENLKEDGRNIRSNIKLLKDTLYAVENDFVKDFLHFPNKLHIKCPIEHVKILYKQGLYDESLNKNATFHLKKTNLIDFKDPSCYYLLNEAAIFDLEFSLNCTDFIVKNGFTQIANPDFSRRILLEAVYSDNIMEYEEIKEHEDSNTSKINTLHLNGGGTFTSFLGFITKLSIFSSILPLKLVSLGRQYYSKSNDLQKERGLFTAMQSNAVHILIATKDEQTADDEMESILNLAVDLYKKLGIHFRVIYEKASEILPAEALRASIQMFSPYFNEYVEVGHISNYSNYISKRILFNFKEGKNFQFPCIIGGPIVDVSKIVGCLIEHNIELESPQFKSAINAIDNFKSLFEI